MINKVVKSGFRIKFFIGLLLILVISAALYFTRDNMKPKTNITINNKITTEEKQKVILHGLGVNFPDDFLFSDSVIYGDDYIKNDKVFVEFGDTGMSANNLNKNVEYWYFLKPGTKISAVTEGTVDVFFIEHTKDWGVSIQQDNSNYIVSFEHLTNLAVEKGGKVRPGDILGEAVPWSANNNVGFTELSVWTGGENIYKFCPFDFLRADLKQQYEQKIHNLAESWEEYIEKDVYNQEKWVSPGCLTNKIQET